MSVATLPQQTTIDDAVEEIWAMVKRGEAPNVAEATRALWNSFTFAVAETQFLALSGMIQIAVDAERFRSQNRKRPLAVGSPHGRKWDEYLNSLGRTFEAADGTQRMLLDWTAEDWAAAAVRWRSLADAYMERAGLAGRAQELLDEHGVVQTRDLPRLVLRELAKSAAEIFGRDDR